MERLSGRKPTPEEIATEARLEEVDGGNPDRLAGPFIAVSRVQAGLLPQDALHTIGRRQFAMASVAMTAGITPIEVPAQEPRITTQAPIALKPAQA